MRKRNIGTFFLHKWFLCRISSYFFPQNSNTLRVFHTIVSFTVSVFPRHYSQVYIVEISEPEVRGRLSAVLKIVNQTGVLLSFAAGAVLNWRQLAFIVALAPAAFFLAVLALPETPSFLMLSGKHILISKVQLNFELTLKKGSQNQYFPKFIQLNKMVK